MAKAIFLDRDGTLNVDTGYVHKIEDWQWLPGVLEALGMFKAAGWLLLVVSNQSGIARGYFSEQALLTLERRLDAMLASAGLAIDAWYYCRHGPDSDCQCRKPKPGLILRAAREWHVKLAESWMLGDRLRDVEAGLAAGCATGLLHNPDYAHEQGIVLERSLKTRIWTDLAAAAREICK